ncbi:unnamed protein product [Chrysoparadoxa australica]
MGIGNLLKVFIKKAPALPPPPPPPLWTELSTSVVNPLPLLAEFLDIAAFSQRVEGMSEVFQVNNLVLALLGASFVCIGMLSLLPPLELEAETKPTDQKEEEPESQYRHNSAVSNTKNMEEDTEARASAEAYRLKMIEVVEEKAAVVSFLFRCTGVFSLAMLTDTVPCLDKLNSLLQAQAKAAAAEAVRAAKAKQEEMKAKEKKIKAQALAAAKGKNKKAKGKAGTLQEGEAQAAAKLADAEAEKDKKAEAVPSGKQAGAMELLMQAEAAGVQAKAEAEDAAIAKAAKELATSKAIKNEEPPTSPVTAAESPVTPPALNTEAIETEHWVLPRPPSSKHATRPSGSQTPSAQGNALHFRVALAGDWGMRLASNKRKAVVAELIPGGAAESNGVMLGDIVEGTDATPFGLSYDKIMSVVGSSKSTELVLHFKRIPSKKRHRKGMSMIKSFKYPSKKDLIGDVEGVGDVPTGKKKKRKSLLEKTKQMGGSLRKIRTGSFSKSPRMGSFSRRDSDTTAASAAATA